MTNETPAKLAELDHELREYMKALSHENDEQRQRLLPEHIDKLLDDRARIMGLPEEGIAVGGSGPP